MLAAGLLDLVALMHVTVLGRSLQALAGRQQQPMSPVSLGDGLACCQLWAVWCAARVGAELQPSAARTIRSTTSHLQRQKWAAFHT